jgi:hypothetical protein
MAGVLTVRSGGILKTPFGNGLKRSNCDVALKNTDIPRMQYYSIMFFKRGVKLKALKGLPVF